MTNDVDTLIRHLGSPMFLSAGAERAPLCIPRLSAARRAVWRGAQFGPSLAAECAVLPGRRGTKAMSDIQRATVCPGAVRSHDLCPVTAPSHGWAARHSCAARPTPAAAVSCTPAGRDVQLTGPDRRLRRRRPDAAPGDLLQRSPPAGCLPVSPAGGRPALRPPRLVCRAAAGAHLRRRRLVGRAARDL